MRGEPGRDKEPQLSPGMQAEASWLGTWVETLSWSNYALGQAWLQINEFINY